jgi:hypothetical protein
MIGLMEALMTPSAARGQSPPGKGDVCITIDEPRDTLSPQDRTASVLLLAREFEKAGWHVAPEGCATSYVVSHVSLGHTVVVSLARRGERREGTALGLDDLPALYSQMVRSILTGRPMTGFKVVDRTNVTLAQESIKRVQSESFGYARLGYGTAFSDRRYGSPSMGFGYRVELDSMGLDLSFLNLQVMNGNEKREAGIAGSWLKLQGLYFLNSKANASGYVGAGLSWGGIDVGGSSVPAYGSSTYTSNWHGSGLQSELTVGYEVPRASTLRVFVQADAVLPFYEAVSETSSYTMGRITRTTQRQHMPSLVVSMGLGWHRHRR